MNNTNSSSNVIVTPVTPSVDPAVRPAPSMAKPSRQERDRLINAASAGMTSRAKQRSDDPLQLWWPQIQRKRREGFTLDQITAMLNSPAIALKVSRRAVKHLVETHAAAEKARQAKTASQPKRGPVA